MKNKTTWGRKTADSRSGMGRYPSEGFGYDRYGYTSIPGAKQEERLAAPTEKKSDRRTTRSGTMGQRKSTKKPLSKYKTSK